MLEHWHLSFFHIEHESEKFVEKLCASILECLNVRGEKKNISEQCGMTNFVVLVRDSAA
jgi:hypothetical protein